VFYEVTEAVHEKGSYIFLQLWALGRAANPKTLAEEDPNFDYVSSSPTKLPEKPETPRALSVDEIHEYVQLYATAAHNAVIAGFDGVEIHGANGYLIEQFLQDTCNQREDDYGGSAEGRTRFAKEIVKAVVDTVGEKKTGIRLSPWNYAGGWVVSLARPPWIDRCPG
jgi:NADPH2 dehydrogenase